MWKTIIILTEVQELLFKRWYRNCTKTLLCIFLGPPKDQRFKECHKSMTSGNIETLNLVMNLVQQGDWAILFDLKNTYLHFLTCIYNQKFPADICFQFLRLPFGPTVYPRVFTNITAVFIANFRTMNIRLASKLSRRLVHSISGVEKVSSKQKHSNRSPCRTRIHDKSV